MKVRVTIDAQVFDVEILDLSARPIQAVIDGKTFQVMPEDMAQLESAPAESTGSTAELCWPVPVSHPMTSANKTAEVRAPIPGVIQTISVREGYPVSPGQDLFILEAMKMKNAIKATRAGIVHSIHVQVGETVTYGQILLKYTE